MKKLYRAAITAAVITILLLTSACSENTAISRGVIEGDAYRSDSAELSFTKPAGWEYMSDEQIASMSQASEDMLDGSKFSEALEKSKSIYDMGCIDKASGSNILVMYTNMNLSEMLAYSEERYLKQVADELISLGQDGISYTGDKNVSQLNICGDNYYSITMQAAYSLNGNTVRMTQTYYARKLGSYMLSIIATDVGSGFTADDFLKCFK